MKITISREDFNRIYEHALSVRPEEACGLIAGEDREHDIRVIRKIYILTNSEHTNDHFTIDPKEQLAVINNMRLNGRKPLGN